MIMDRDIPDWLNVSRETIERLEHYAAEVLRWNPAINLVSKPSIPLLWQRHILDSAQLFPLAPPTGIWADLGAGGGFPGIVLTSEKQAFSAKWRASCPCPCVWLQKESTL
jgi:16S rRNA (guanine527-N7)-methyltransferase